MPVAPIIRRFTWRGLAVLNPLILSGTRRACALALVALLAACGGGSAQDPGDGGNPPEPPPAPARSGQLESAALLGTVPAADIAAALAAKESLAQDVVPRYSVTSELEPVRARDPGEYTGGAWEYLYPPRPTTAAPPSS